MKGRVIQKPEPKRNLASDCWEHNRDDTTTDTTTTEMDDSSNEQRGADPRISEKKELPIALPLNKSNLFLEGAVEAEEAQKADTVAIDLADVIDHLRKKNLLDQSKEQLRDSVKAFLDSWFEAVQELDEIEKADLKSQQAGRMADVLKERKDEISDLGSATRESTLTMLENAFHSATSKLKDASKLNNASKLNDARKKSYTPLMEALQEIAASIRQNEGGDEELNLIQHHGGQENHASESSMFFRHISPPPISFSVTQTPSLKKPTITDAKIVLEQNRLTFEQLASNGSFQKEARDLQEVIREKHAEFLLEESISNKAAETKAKENKEFLHQKIRELEEIKAGGSSEFLPNDSMMERWDEIIQGLQTRSDAYQQLATIYQEMPHEERASLFKLLKSEQASSSSTSSDKRILLGNHGRMRVEEAPPNLEDVDQQNARDGMMVASLEILERFGPYALHRFNKFFHTEMMDPAPLAVKKLKEFVTSEEKKEKERTSGFKSLFLTKDSKGIEILNRIHQRSLDLSYKGSEQEKTDQERLIRLDGSQVDFNPFAANKFSKKYLVEEGKMAHGGVLGIEEVLRNGEIEFAKNMTAPKRHDIANHFFKQFNDTGKYKNALTASALASFFKVESEKQQKWSDRLYYGCFSKLYDKLPEQYKINRQGWSIFQAIISAVKGQPVITQLGKELGVPLWNTNISTAISVVMTWGTTWLGDQTRPSRKPPIINKENIEEGSSRRNYDLREAADEFSDNRVLMGLHYLVNRGDVKPAFEKRRKFVIVQRSGTGRVAGTKS